MLSLYTVCFYLHNKQGHSHRFHFTPVTSKSACLNYTSQTSLFDDNKGGEVSRTMLRDLPRRLSLPFTSHHMFDWAASATSCLCLTGISISLEPPSDFPPQQLISSQLCQLLLSFKRTTQDQRDKHTTRDKRCLIILMNTQADPVSLIPFYPNYLLIINRKWRIYTRYSYQLCGLRSV